MTSQSDRASHSAIEGGAGEPQDSDAQVSPARRAADETEAPAQEWWQDERMPWSGTPTKQDKMAFGAIIGYGIYSLILLPLRPLLIARPNLAIFITGSSIATTVIGGQVATGSSWLWAGAVVIAALSVCKFDWIYWWAGKLWGQGLIDYLMRDRSERAKRRADKAQQWAKNHAVASMALTYVPFLPVPSAVIYAALGARGLKLGTFLVLDVVLGVVSRSIYFTLGYLVGQPVVDALETFGQYAWYVSIALIIGIFVVTFVRQSRHESHTAAAKKSDNAQE